MAAVKFKEYSLWCIYEKYTVNTLYVNFKDKKYRQGTSP